MGETLNLTETIKTNTYKICLKGFREGGATFQFLINRTQH